MRRSILAFTLAGALGACSDSGSSGPPQPGCDKTSATGGTCWVNSTVDSQTAEATCGTELGTWSPAGCPGGDVVGICTESTGRITYYFSNNYDLYATHDAASACGSTGGTFIPMGQKVTASCDLRANPMFNSCIDLSGTVSDVNPDSIAVECGYLGGTWSTTDACPTSGRTGTCSDPSGGVDVERHYYNGETAADVGCVDPGETWSPG